MKTVHNQDTESTRNRFVYDPSRHYVRAEMDSQDWDGATLDALLNETLPDGSDAYRIEADGSKGPDQRRIAGSRRVILLSCPKSHIEQRIKEHSDESRRVAAQIAKPTEDTWEELKELEAITVRDTPK